MSEQNFMAAFAATAATSPGVRFICHSEVEPADVTLGEIFEAGCNVGERLKQKRLGPRPVIAVMLPSWKSWLTACVGSAYAGAIFMPIVMFLKARELAFILRQSRASVLITPWEFRGVDFAALLQSCGELPDLKHHFTVGKGEGGGGAAAAFAELETFIPKTGPVTVDKDDCAYLVYTSGTTGTPKGVKHSGSTFLSVVEAFAKARGDDDERILSPWPPGHVAGSIQLIRFLALKTQLVTMDQWSAEVAADLIDRYGITSSSGTSFHMSALLEVADRTGLNLSSLRNYLLGAAPVPTALVERCVALGVKVGRGYGSSEHPSTASSQRDDPLEKRLSSEGRAMAGTEIQIVDDDGAPVAAGVDGEIVTRGAGRFIGYLDPDLDADAFLPGGWYRTGDIGHLDRDGYLHVTDRKKDIIIRAGENISSREVEDALRSMPGIVDAAAVAIKDPRYGERVKVFVEAPELNDLSLAMIQAHFEGIGMSKQKTPEAFEIIGELPRNAAGKVLKATLRAAGA